MNKNNIITWDFYRSACCSRYYAIRNGKVFAEIVKYDDTKSEINPFKVSFPHEGDYKPDTCFWSNYQDYLKSKENDAKSYFKSAFGGLKEAKDYIRAWKD